MKETRTCAVCPETFSCKSTSPRRTCSRKCSRQYTDARKAEYAQRPETKERQRAYQRRPEVKELILASGRRYRARRREREGVLS